MQKNYYQSINKKMGEMQNDGKPIKVEPPRINQVRAGSSPDANNMLDNLLENVGLKRNSGGETA